MSITVADAVRVMDELAPPSLAESWDNVGLQTGHPDWEVSRIWISLDPLPDVVEQACRENIDLLITHHPLIFKPLNSINFASPIGRIIHMASSHNLSIFSAHTNLDSVQGGINEILADKIGLKRLSVLDQTADSDQTEGIGRVGELDSPMPLFDLARKIKENMGIDRIKAAGSSDLMVHRAALCSGSGSSLMEAFYASGAQVYISGDFRYHDARDAEMQGVGIIDISHFASEHLMCEVLADQLKRRFMVIGADVNIEACRIESEPFISL